MFPIERQWTKQPGASSVALQELRVKSAIRLPQEYFDLLAWSNGGEGPLLTSPYNFCLDSAEDAISNHVSNFFSEDFPGFFVFGGSGGGEYIAFDHRGAEPWPVVAIDMTNIDLSESVQLIAKDFSSFLTIVGTD